VIDAADIRGRRFLRAKPFLDEGGAGFSPRTRRWRRAAAALRPSPWRPARRGAARNTIASRNCARHNPIGDRVRSSGGDRKRTVPHQPGIPAALEALVEDAIRGDPYSILRRAHGPDRLHQQALR
jgi:hypothetical protein